MDGKAKAAEIIMLSASTILAGMLANPQNGRASEASMLKAAFGMATELFLLATQAAGIKPDSVKGDQ